jgi:hypothetical protein
MKNNNTYKPSKISGTVRVTQLVEELSDGDDQDELPAGNDGKGSYADYEVDSGVADFHVDPEELLLDEFHETHAIGCLDDFHIEVIKVNDF